MTASVAISVVPTAPATISFAVTASVAISVVPTAPATICALEAVPDKSPPIVGSDVISAKVKLPEPSVVIACPAVPPVSLNCAVVNAIL